VLQDYQKVKELLKQQQQQQKQKIVQIQQIEVEP
jgi:hypothetical protein